MRLIQTRRTDWREPLEVAAGLGDAPWALCLLSDGGAHGRWSYVMAEPETTATRAIGDPAAFEALRDPLGSQGERMADGPPFQGGVAGLAAYDLTQPRRAGDTGWPGLILALYGAAIAFDHHARVVWLVGRGATPPACAAALDRAQAWLDGARAPRAIDGPLAPAFEAEAPPQAYVDAVADVVARIAAGELFQANIARAWRGELAPSATPFDVFARLTRQSPAPYAAYWRLPGRALVSNSPEAFITVRPGGRIAARPIKGTRPRGATPEADAAFAQDLIASAKDRAENLMIVDLMRNDLSRVCQPGSVTAPELFALERYATVQHLVSTVEGRLRPGADASAVLAATFPPGSITGAPKHQAMKVIADHEPPRGAWCGSLFLAGQDGTLDASVLIRSLALDQTETGWRWRTLAGAGIVADSDPVAELAETDAKISAIRRALTAHSQG